MGLLKTILTLLSNLFTRRMPDTVAIPPQELPKPPVEPPKPPQIPLPPATTPLERFMKALPMLKNRGFDVYSVLTHAWHETGGFKSAVGQNNFFGITVPTGWTGAVLEVVTHENVYFQGRDPNEALVYAKKQWPSGVGYAVAISDKPGFILIRVKVVRKFVDWVTADEALIYYCDKIQRMYPQAYSFRNVPAKYFMWLVSGKYQWATDGAYVTELNSLYNVLMTRADVKTQVDSALA